MVKNRNGNKHLWRPPGVETMLHHAQSVGIFLEEKQGTRQVLTGLANWASLKILFKCQAENSLGLIEFISIKKGIV